MIELHSYPTSNGQKVMLMLEETGLPWQHIDVNIRLGEQFSATHLQLSPNNKIPALVDPDGPGGRYTLMESNAILIYLAEKTGRFLPASGSARYDVLQWLIFQSSHVGPMIGQANHFNNHSDVQYGRDRYNQEVARLFKVIENRLATSPWIGGADYSIADMALYPWCRNRKGMDITPASHPAFLAWFAKVEARPAVRSGNAKASEIRKRMDDIYESAEAAKRINLYDTRDNLQRLEKASRA